MSSPTLGTGALLHGAFCLANAGKAFLSQHVGDLDTEESMAAYREALDRFREVFRIEPEIVAHDLHPDFMTTRFAASLGLPTVAVQHHHAHVAATMAEHGLDGEVLGLAFDGLGLGDDGTVWGGELLVCDAAGYRRVGRLRQVRPARRGRGHARPGRAWRWRTHAMRACSTPRSTVSRRRPRSSTWSSARSRRGSPRPGPARRAACSTRWPRSRACADRASFEGQPAMLLEQAVREPVGDARAVPGRRAARPTGCSSSTRAR